MQNEPLSEASQAILNEITAYHASRLHAFESESRARKAASDRHLPARISRAIEQMMRDGLSGAEREWAQETARLVPGRNFDPHRLFIPFSAFRRDLNVASAGAGGYLVDAATLPARDILRPWSVTLQGGVTVAESLMSDAIIPQTTTEPTIVWASSETAEATPSTPMLAQAAMTPKNAIGVIQASRQFMRQADPESWIRRLFLRAGGKIVDTAVMDGSGASGELEGVLQSQGLNTQSGTSLAWAGVLAMKRAAADKNAMDGTISFISTPTVRELLEARERATGGGTFIWEDNQIAGAPAFATTLMPAGTMLSGPMGEITLGLWGGGLQIEINPYDPVGFKAGIVQIRVIVSCDVAITCNRGAFTKAESIT